MPLNPTLLTQFSNFAKKYEITPDVNGFEKLNMHIDSIPLGGFSWLLGNILPFLKNVNDNIPQSEKAGIAKILEDLEIRKGTELEQKEWLKNVFANQAIQNCLVEQLKMHQKKSGLSDEDMLNMESSEKKSFAHKALEDFSDKLSNNLKMAYDRNVYDPIGLFFNTLFEGIGMIFDIMLNETGVKVPDSEKNIVGVKDHLNPVNNPLCPEFLK